jgi:hypothetical protein
MSRIHGNYPIVSDGLVFCMDIGNSAKGYQLGQNYFPYSEDITLQSGGWTATFGSGNDYGGTGTIPITTVDYGIAPDGTQTADRIQLDKGSGTTSSDRSGIRYAISMVNRTLSYYVKFLDSTTIEQFTTSVYPQGTTWTYDTLSDGWYRVKCTGSTSVSVRIQYVGGGAEQTSLDALVWGIQLEDGSVANDYVKTTGTPSPVVYDLTGRGNNGSLLNGPTYSSDNRGSLIFDGVDDYASFNLTDVNVDSSCTIECVARRFTTPVAWRTYFNIKSNSTNSPFFEFRTEDADLNIICLYYNGTNYFTSSYTVNTTDFYHFTGTYNGNGIISYYVNGTFVGSISSVPNFSIGNNPILTIGRSYGNDRPTDISMPICRVYNKVLSLSEIEQNFNSLRGRFGL